MKPLLSLVCLSLSLFACIGMAEEYLPPIRPSLDTYLAKAGRNPFGPASEKEVEAAKPDFARNLYINGIMNYNGEVTVYIANKNDKSVFSLTPSRSHEEFKLEEYEISPTVGASTVTITNGSETAKLTFDQAQMFSSSSTSNNKGKSSAARSSDQQTQSKERASAIPEEIQTRAERQKKKPRRPVRVIRAPRSKRTETN